MSRIENQIIARLRGIGTACNANEILRVYAKFNVLFVRSKVRAFFSYYDLSAERH